MKKFFQLFLRVIGSYNIEERVVSLILSVLVVFLMGQMVVGIFRGGGMDVKAEGGYTEGIVSANGVLINPLFSNFSDANRDVSSLVFSGLMKYSPVVKGFVADLGEMTVSGDKKTYSFKVRDDVYWHDGEKFSIDDVYFTYHDLIQSDEFQNSLLKANFDGVKISVVSDNVIEFTLMKPNSFFISNFNIGILPKHLLKDVSVSSFIYDEFNSHPVGTGPYKVKDIIMGDNGDELVSLIVNKKFYGNVPQIDEIKFHVYPNLELLFEGKDTLNVVAKVPFEYVDAFKEDTRFKLTDYVLPQYTALFFNMNKTFLQDLNVRKGILSAVDSVKLVSLLKWKSIFNVSLLGCSLKDDDSVVSKFNLDDAKKFFDTAGFKLKDGDEFRKNKKGDVLKFVLLVRKFDDESLANEMNVVSSFLVDSLKEVGVQVVVDFEVLSEFNNKLQMRDYDFVLTGESLGYDSDFYAYWHSSQANGNGLNLSNYKSFNSDSLIEKARSVFDLKEKQGYLNDFIKLVYKDVPVVFLYTPSYVFATDGKVHKMAIDKLVYLSDRFFSVGNFCIDC